MKLLVPVDGSTASVNAFLKAVELAKKENYIIKLINIIKHDDSMAYKRNEKLWRQVDGSIITGRPLSVTNEQGIRKAKDEAEELLDSLIKHYGDPNVTVEKEVLLGEPFEKILEVSQQEPYEMIVMGNRGFSRIKRFFVGSVAQRVISEAKCPVLVIHTDAEV